MLGIKDALAVELGQLSDGQDGENGNDGASAGDDDSANLDQFDEQQAAQAAAELGDEAGEGEAAADGEGEAGAEGEQGEGESDEPKPADAPESEQEQEKPAEGEGEKPKHPELQARIDELTKRAKTAEEQVQAQAEQLATYRARDEGRLDPDVLEHVDTAADLAQAQQRYSALLQWAIRNPDGGKLGEREYDAEQVRELHAEVQTLITEAVPARREYLAKREAAERDAVTFYPWLKDTAKGAGAIVLKAVQDIPGLRKLPNYRMLAADAFVGQVLRSNGISMTDTLLARLVAEVKASQGKGKPAATPQGQAQRKPPGKPPAAPSRAGALPPRQAPRVAAAKAAGTRLRQSNGSEDDLAGSIAAKL